MVAAPRTWRGDAAWLLTAGAVLLVPLIAVPNGLDPFRVPKELMLRAFGMLLLVYWAWRAFDRESETEKLPRRHLLVLAAICGWSVFAALFASHKIHAAFALLWIFSGVLLFLTAFHAVQRRSLMAVAAVALVPPLINAALAIAEMSTGWYPFLVDHNPGRAIGLQGNANDLGALLAPSVIFALAIAAAVRRLRWAALACVVVLALGIVASQTLTSTIAVIGGIAAMIIVHFGRRGVIAAIGVAILIGIFAYVYSPLRARIANVGTRLQSGQLEEAMSNRLTPWLVAWRMSAANPVMGVGPGGFAWDYFPYKIETEQRYFRFLGLDRVRPGFSRYASTINYGEAHNEFLEVLAEAGWPALAILVAALLVIATSSRAKSRDPLPSAREGDASTSLGMTRVADERAAVARYLSVPFAVTAALSFAGGFPMQIAGSYVLLIFITAIAVGWARAR